MKKKQKVFWEISIPGAWYNRGKKWFQEPLPGTSSDYIAINTKQRDKMVNRIFSTYKDIDALRVSKRVRKPGGWRITNFVYRRAK